nr:hypothetical protein YSBCXYJI_YSBCXYJI_CDS_0055 [Caudoviricetes sp.]
MQYYCISRNRPAFLIFRLRLPIRSTDDFHVTVYHAKYIFCCTKYVSTVLSCNPQLFLGGSI